MSMSAGKATLFLGDLSTFCTEVEIHNLFKPYGEITEIKIMRSEETYRNLSYGFIKFLHPNSAKRAMMALNGMLFCGRNLRVGWASYKSKKEPKNVPHHDRMESSSVHISFISYQLKNLITEESLRQLFCNYGVVLDTSIKKCYIDQSINRQCGYGFVHFASTQEGIEAALAAVAGLNDATIDNVCYKCSISHNLEKHLLDGNAIRPQEPHNGHFIHDPYRQSPSPTFDQEAYYLHQHQQIPQQIYPTQYVHAQNPQPVTQPQYSNLNTLRYAYPSSNMSAAIQGHTDAREVSDASFRAFHRQQDRSATNAEYHYQHSFPNSRHHSPSVVSSALYAESFENIHESVVHNSGFEENVHGCRKQFYPSNQLQQPIPVQKNSFPQHKVKIEENIVRSESPLYARSPSSPSTITATVTNNSSNSAPSFHRPVLSGLFVEPEKKHAQPMVSPKLSLSIPNQVARQDTLTSPLNVGVPTRAFYDNLLKLSTDESEKINSKLENYAFMNGDQIIPSYNLFDASPHSNQKDSSPLDQEFFSYTPSAICNKRSDGVSRLALF